MSIVERIKHLLSGKDRTVDTADARIDAVTSARSTDQIMGGEHGGLPPNYLPTGVDEGRPKK